MKVEITKAQLKAIQDAIDTVEGMVGNEDQDFNEEATKAARIFDRFLKKNNLPPRKYGPNRG
ncbi:hypothetical protein [Flagellimonas sp.]|uniref:hypothetical protein n=1 Tax=Flagellimonas sp. TaxID=2058762 RepID=UPI003F4A7EF9